MSAAEVITALAEPNRFHIVELLRTGPHPVNDIVLKLKLNQPQVSKHLKVLSEAGLVEKQPLAQQRIYQLRPQPLKELHSWLEPYRQLWEKRLDRLDAYLLKLKNERKQK